ncbi:MAG: hypothetical protein HHJ10_01395 [Cellulomonas sp.]|uniref:hypothetical protein n=1 Tax=Cellulomonas sp. TaxID=40001 RepID=UPI0017C83011|nr:hypothetical protein [Cellulomonas sp.]NMM29724.1 hypothetical protein [Cellulomonas sp.]
MDPGNDLWAPFGAYRFEVWRLVARTGPVDTPIDVHALHRLLGLEDRGARRVLARMRTVGLLAQGVMHATWMADGAVFGQGFDLANARFAHAQQERAAYSGVRDGTAASAAAIWAQRVDLIALAEQVGSTSGAEFYRSMDSLAKVTKFLAKQDPAVVEVAPW